MPKIEIYTSPFCGFCFEAKELLKSKGVNYTEIDVTSHSNLHSEMKQRSGGQKTVPQIFIDNNHVGGCDDLYSLNARGELDKLLNQKLG